MLKLFFAAAATLVLFSPTLQAQNRQPRARALYEQSRLGVTVRLEKIAVQRVLVNLKRPDKAEKWEQGQTIEQQLQKNLEQHRRETQLAVSIFISVSGGGNRYGPIKIDYLKDHKPSNHATVFKSPPLWVPYVQGIDVDPEATGIKETHYLPTELSLRDLFPIKVTVDAITKTGEKVKFTYKNVTF